MPKSTFEGFIEFENIPVHVKLYSATDSDESLFRTVHQCSKNVTSKVKEKKFCEHCSTEVTSGETSRAIEVAEGKYVVVSDEEIASLKAEKADTIKISAFVPISQIDPIYYSSGYYVAPEDNSRDTYKLLFSALASGNSGALACWTYYGKERNVLIRAYSQGLMIHTLHAAKDIRNQDDFFGFMGDVVVDQKELTDFRKLMKSKMKSFDPSSLKSQYNERLAKFVEDKKKSYVSDAIQEGVKDLKKPSTKAKAKASSTKTKKYTLKKSAVVHA